MSTSLSHQRLVSEATLFGTEAILQQLPTEHSPALEQAIRQGVRQAVLSYAEGRESLNRQFPPPRPGKGQGMSDWSHRVHPSGPSELQAVRDAARDIGQQAERAPGRTGIVFRTVADCALIGTAVLSGALASVHLWRALFPRHKEQQHGPKAAPGATGRPPSPPSHHRRPHAPAGEDAGESSRWERARAR